MSQHTFVTQDARLTPSPSRGLDPKSPSSTPASAAITTLSFSMPFSDTSPQMADGQNSLLSTVTASGHPSFRRQRASRACETCHARKVRCDAASLGVPCTNCTAFSIECRIPAPKRKRPSKGKYDDDSDRPEKRPELGPPPSVEPTSSTSPTFPDHPPPQSHESSPIQNDTARSTSSEQSPDDIPMHEKPPQYPQSFVKPKFARAPIKEAGRVAFLGESSNLTLLVNDKYGTTDVVHYPLPEYVRGAKARVSELDNIEIDILNRRVVPVINRCRFMHQYRDSANPPSLLLLQAIFLAGSRVCTNPQLKDSTGSTTPAAMTFYKRAKALYDANYEDDRVTIVQALILMGWYWEGPEDVTKNVFYWSRVAIVVAQGSGMHRSVENTQLNQADKRLWKRIWWTLFSRDRSCAVALGRPIAINPEDSDVEMISEDDFLEHEEDNVAEYLPDAVHVNFFINYVKLCEIMGLVLSQQYSVASKYRRGNSIELAQSDMALADWRQNCPKNVEWEKSKHHYWAALLHANYYTTLCLLHRAHMPPAGSPKMGVSNGVTHLAYPSTHIAGEAAILLTTILDTLQEHDEIKYTPAFIIYSLFSALIMHVYKMRSSDQSVVAATEDRIKTCMSGLKEVSKVWLVAKMVHSLFESILGNKVLEERLQKAAGKRHRKPSRVQLTSLSSSRTSGTPANQPSQPRTPNPQAPPPPPLSAQPSSSGARILEPVPLKRKFEDMDLGFVNSHPTPTVSYERSRPQTPSETTPSRELPARHQKSSMAVPSSSGPGVSLRGLSPREPRKSQDHGITNNGNGVEGRANGANVMIQQQQQQQQQQQHHQQQQQQLQQQLQQQQQQQQHQHQQQQQHQHQNMANFSVPTMPAESPAELFLVTRNLPLIPNDIWKGIQPYELLFPDESNVSFSLADMPGQLARDDGLMGQQQQQQQQNTAHTTGLSNSLGQDMSGGRHIGSDGLSAGLPPPEFTEIGTGGSVGGMGSTGWLGDPTVGGDGVSGLLNSDDTSSSSSQPLIPATLNVEDWLAFFGMANNHDYLNNMSGGPST